MEVIGKIVRAFPEQSGVSRSGNNWKKREYLLEVQDGSQYPQTIFFNFFGDKADQYIMNEGDVVKLFFDIRTREYNGKYYTDINGWKTEPVDATAPMQTPQAQPQAPVQNPYGTPTIPTADLAPNGPKDDLPF